MHSSRIAFSRSRRFKSALPLLAAGAFIALGCSGTDDANADGPSASGHTAADMPLGDAGIPLGAQGPEAAVLKHPVVYTGPKAGSSLAKAAVTKPSDDTFESPGWSGNFVKNPGFEEDFVNVNAEGHVLSFKGDWYYNQQDLKPDYWGINAPDGDPFGGWKRVTGARSGKYALQLDAGRAASQSYPGAMYNQGGSAWSPGGAVKLPIAEGELTQFRQPWRATVWVKGAGTLALNARLNRDGTIAGGVTATAKGGNSWQKLTVEVPADQAPHPHSGMGVILLGPGTFDDLVVQERFADSPNLVPDPSFENADDDYPVGWSQQQKYRSIGPTYYVWTDWNHTFAPNRGSVQIDTAVAHTGKQSVRFDVYPGDEKLIESDVIPVNQSESRIIEVGVWVRADRINMIDLRLVDQDGFYMPAVRPRAPEWKNGGSFLFGNGTFGWRYIRKFFGSLDNVPVKGVRVRLAARGFNGHTLEDFGTRPQFMQVGTVWWDDVRVIERASTAADLQRRGVKPPRTSAPKAGTLVDGEVDPGERMFGENAFTYQFTNNGGSASYSLRLTTSLPEAEPMVTESGSVKASNGQRVTLSAPYTLDRLVPHLSHQATFKMEVLRNGDAVATETYAFNTWPVVADIDVARAYSLPTENPLPVAINLAVSDVTLGKIAKLEASLVDVKTGKVHSTKTYSDLSKEFARTVASLPSEPTYENEMPTPEYWVDRFNLILDKLDLSKLKVWPHDYPVRDTKLVLVAKDRSGKALFTQDSDPFGRMNLPPKSPPIKSVTIREEDHAVLINGEPKILTGGSGHPSNRKGSYSAKVRADLGLLGTRLSHGKENNHDEIRAMWDKYNLYSLMIKPVQGMGSVTVVTDMNPQQRTDFEGLVESGGLESVVTINTGGWEATIDTHNEKAVATHKALNEWLRKTSKRPVAVSTSGAYNAWWLNKLTFYDINHAETEMWGPMDYNVIWTPYMKENAGRPVAWLYLPQLYDNHPYERYRFESYENMLRGSVGVSWIQGIGDPTFSRGLAGEMRYIEKPFFSLEKAPKVTTMPNGVSHKVTKHDGKTYIFATNCGPVSTGHWKWNTSEKQSGTASHEGDSWNDYWQRPGGVRIHGMRGMPMPPLIQKGDKFIQHVWVDPDDKPNWIAVALRGNGKFIHNVTLGDFDFNTFRDADANMFMFSELNHSVWHEAYIIADDETYERSKRIMGEKDAKRLMKDRYDAHRKIVAERIYQPEHFRNLGKLPKAGQWHTIEIDAEKVGAVGKLVDGVAWLTQDGRALWDNTQLVRDGEVIRVFSDDAAGINRNALPKVRFYVDGLKKGTKIKVLFEEREIVAEDGYFEDDFTGTDTYGYESRAPEGDLLPYPDLPANRKDEDKELPRMLPSGHGYNYGPTVVHMYEISK